MDLGVVVADLQRDSIGMTANPVDFVVGELSGWTGYADRGAAERGSFPAELHVELLLLGDRARGRRRQAPQLLDIRFWAPMGLESVG